MKKDRKETISLLEGKNIAMINQLKKELEDLPKKQRKHLKRVNKAFDFLDAHKNGENYLIEGKEAILFHDFHFPNVTLLFRPAYSCDDIGNGAGMSLTIKL